MCLTAVILLGASQFPKHRGYGANFSFLRSKQDFRAYLQDEETGLSIPDENILDLFDYHHLPALQLVAIGDFLDRFSKGSQADELRNLLVYYVGHGFFCGLQQEYYLAVASVRIDYESATGLRIVDLAEVIKQHARVCRRFIFLDCCYAAEAVTMFQGSAEDAIALKARDAFSEDATPFPQDTPSQGTALFCAASKDQVAKSPPGVPRTIFADALLDVLTTGDRHAPPKLTLSQVAELTWQRLCDKFPTSVRVRPAVHSPDQSVGDIATRVALFPNAYRPQSQQKRTAQGEARRAVDLELRGMLPDERRTASEARQSDSPPLQARLDDIRGGTPDESVQQTARENTGNGTDAIASKFELPAALSPVIQQEDTSSMKPWLQTGSSERKPIEVAKRDWEALRREPEGSIWANVEASAGASEHRVETRTPTASSEGPAGSGFEMMTPEASFEDIDSTVSPETQAQVSVGPESPEVHASITVPAGLQNPQSDVGVPSLAPDTPADLLLTTVSPELPADVIVSPLSTKIQAEFRSPTGLENADTDVESPVEAPKVKGPPAIRVLMILLVLELGLLASGRTWPYMEQATLLLVGITTVCSSWIASLTSGNLLSIILRAILLSLMLLMSSVVMGTPGIIRSVNWMSLPIVFVGCAVCGYGISIRPKSNWGVKLCGELSSLTHKALLSEWAARGGKYRRASLSAFAIALLAVHLIVLWGPISQWYFLASGATGMNYLNALEYPESDYLLLLRFGPECILTALTIRRPALAIVLAVSVCYAYWVAMLQFQWTGARDETAEGYITQLIYATSICSIWVLLFKAISWLFSRLNSLRRPGGLAPEFPGVSLTVEKQDESKEHFHGDSKN